MYLTSLKVLELNEKYHLIEDLCERDLENPEGVGLDLRVGRVEKIIGGRIDTKQGFPSGQRGQT